MSLASNRRAEVQTHFDNCAVGNRWGELYNPSNPDSQGFLARRRKARVLLGDLKGVRLLELGCGSGALIELLVDQEVEYYGVDNVARMVHHASECIRGLGLTSRFKVQVADVESLPYRDETFDAVIGLGLLEYFGDPQRVLREVLRVSKPGARLVFNAPRKFCLDNLLIEATGPLRAAAHLILGKPPGIQRALYAKRQFQQLFAGLGCRLVGECGYSVKIIPYPFSLFWPGLASRAAARVEDQPGLDFFATGYLVAYVK